MYKKLFIFFYFLLTAKYSLASWFEWPGPTLQEHIVYYFNITMASAGILALVVLTASGLQLIFYAGNPEKTSEAKKRTTSAVIGLVITLSSFLIIQTINPKLKNLNPTEQPKFVSAFQYTGGSDGAYFGKKSGCPINQCLGTDGSCSGENCGGYDFTGCEEEGGCAGTDGCSWANCINPFSRCGAGQCLGGDGSCDWGNCNWAIYKPAPLSMENMDEIIEKYSLIKWENEGTDLSGNTINFCDPGNSNLVYNLYLYKNYNFKNLYNVIRMRCDDWLRQIGEETKSYMLVKETPGVYFYGNENCYPSGDNPPTAFTESIPEAWPEEVKSIRIVNDPDPIKGPFFGLIYFNDTDYKTNQNNPLVMDISPIIWVSPSVHALNNYSYCYNVGSIRNGSWVIYQWVGLKADGKSAARAGDGVTLYTKTEWLGGSWGIKDKEDNRGSSGVSMHNINDLLVFYPKGSVPEEEQKLCPKFSYPECFKSFQIKGSYLVIISSGPSYGVAPGPIPPEPYRGPNPRPYFFNSHAQAFPISPRLKETSKEEIYRKQKEDYSTEKGTLELSLDYIGWLKQVNYVTVIPLAEKLK